MTFIHDTAVVDDNVKIGKDVFIWHFSHILSGSSIGDNCTLGQNIMVGPKVKIGNGCKIQNNVSIYEGIEIGNNVFCGPSCVFTNVINPRAFINRKMSLKKLLLEKELLGVQIVQLFVVIKIGNFALIGAGCSNKKCWQLWVYVGVPARRVGWVSESGIRLGII